MNTLHEHFVNNVAWYKKWHSVKSHHVFHWLGFLLIALLFTGSILSVIDKENAVPVFADPHQSEAAITTEHELLSVTGEILKTAQEYESADAAEKPEKLAELIALTQERNTVLKKAFKKNPSAIKKNLIPKGLRAKLPVEVQNLIEEEKEISGIFNWIISEGNDEATVEDTYSIVDSSGNRKAKIYLSNPDQHPRVTTGQSITVKAITLGDEAVIDNADIKRTVAGDSTTNLVTTTKKVAVIVVNYTSNTNQPATVDMYKDLIFTGSPSAKKYYDEVSNGTWSIQGHTNVLGDVFGTYTIDYTKPAGVDYPNIDMYGEGYKIKTLADAAAGRDGFNAANYNNIIYVLPNSWSALNGFAEGGGKNLWMDGDNRLVTITHELGHNYQLGHAGVHICYDANNNLVAISNSCYDTMYGDPFDVMSNNSAIGGNPFGHHQIMHKATTANNGSINTGPNWIDPSKIVSLTPTVGASNTYTLIPMESNASTGTQMIKIVRDIGGVQPSGNYISPSNYYLEYRQPIGYDAASDPQVFSGVTIHLAGNTDSYSDAYLIDTHPSYSTTFSGLDAAQRAGETYYDPYRGISISTISADSTGARVKVSFTAPECENKIPQVSSTSYTQTGAAGSNLIYNVTLKNGDTTNCTSSTFNMGLTLPSGWSATPMSYTETLAPGASVTRSFSITSPSTATGSNIFSVTATNSSNQRLTSRTDYAFIIGTPPPPPPTGDTTPPTVSITSPVNGTVLTAKGGTKINMSASDTSGISKMEIKLDGAVLATCTRGNTCSTTTPKNVAVGTHTISATAWDKAPAKNSAVKTISVTR